MSLQEIHNERLLLARIAQADQQAFRQLFESYNKLLFTFVEQIIKSASDAEEIVQQCFIKLWMNRGRLQQVDNPGAYLYAMARNKTIDHIRKIARDRVLQQQVWVNMQQADHSLEETIRTSEYQEIINRTLATLPEKKQTVYRLSREAGLSHEEIARQTGLSKSRVNNILAETLRLIRYHLEQHSISLGFIFWILNK